MDNYNNNDKINNPTKNKNKKDKKLGKIIKKSNKNSGKIMFRNISDYFK